MAITTRRGVLLSGAGFVAAGVAGSAWMLSAPGGAIITPGVARARRVASDAVLPSTTEVVVIGGGFVGCAAALTLAERGIPVVLCEKGVVAGEASGRSLGWVDGQLLDPLKMELVGRSKQLWMGMSARLGAESGFRPNGLASLFETPKDVGDAENWLASVKGMSMVNARMVGPEEIERLFPRGSRRWAGGMFQASDGSVEPTLAAPAMAEAMRRHGGILAQGCAVRGIETQAGRISGVVTEKGSIACKAVVLAGGVWSPLFARSLGLDLPQFEAFASMTRIAGVQGPSVSAWGPGFTWRRQIDESYTVAAITGVTPITPAVLRNAFGLIPALRHMWGEVEPVFNARTFAFEWNQPHQWALDRPSPFEAHRIIMPEIRTALLDDVVAKLGTAYPQFQSGRRVENWGGILVSTLDNMPVIGQLASPLGLYLGTGFYYGLTMGPAAGEALADLVMGHKPRIDLSNYRPERFWDGSSLSLRA